MLAKKWLDRAGAANDAIGARLADATDTLASTWHDAQHALSRQRAAGIASARAFGSDVRRVGSSTRSLIVERPLEALLIAGVVGFALGWLIRRSRENGKTAARAGTAKAGGGRSGAGRQRRRPPARKP